MLPKSQHSVTTRLLLIAVVSCCTAVLLSAVGYLYSDIQFEEEERLDEIRFLGDVLTTNATELMSREDTADARRLLDSLRSHPAVEIACLFDANGRLLSDGAADAVYHRDADSPHAVPDRPTYGVRFDDNRHFLYCGPIERDGVEIGSLYISANSEPFFAEMERNVLLSGIVMAVSLILSVALAMVMQRAITRPVVQLAETARQISSRGDYSIRVRHDSRDEIGNLYKAFNHMLQRVQQSEGALQGAYEELDDRVRRRTAQLRQEIQERQRVQDELMRAIEVAEAASNSKSEFLANMSHEIRTPLNSILGFTDLLLRGADGGHPVARQEYLETIQTSGKHLLELINDILDLSKIEAGRLDVELETCSPHSIIAEIISVTRISAVDKHLDLRYVWESGMPARIKTDPAKFRQLLLNVIGNAIKFTEKGGVTVRAKLTDDRRPMLQVAIEDSGIGIEPTMLREVFRPFVQADSSMTRRFGGTGLGLAISTRIARALGGDLTAESKPGEGSTFTIVIDPGSLEGVAIIDSPLSDAIANGANGKSDSASDGSRALKDANILLVEDGATNRKVIGIMLRQAGARVETAENGKLGVEEALAHPYDLILMDMQMPVMDGYTAASRLRQDGLDIPIVALTAHAMKGDEERCLDAGCSGYLSKPVEFEDLVSTLVRFLRRDDANESDVDATGDASVPAPLDDSPIRSKLPVENRAFAEIVGEFVEQLHRQVQAMRLAADGRRAGPLRELTHWLRGTGGTAGFPRLTELASLLNVSVHTEDWDRIEQLLAEIERFADRIETPVLP